MNKEDLNILLDDVYKTQLVAGTKVYLKIKDNVDLKELENCGFKYYKDLNPKRYSCEPRLDCDLTIYEDDFISPYEGYIIHPKRIVLLNPSAGYCEDRKKQEKTFKQICNRLIKADLAEKVEKYWGEE